MSSKNARNAKAEIVRRDVKEGVNRRSSIVQEK